MTKISSSNVKSGNVKDPYHPQVLGVGYLGVGRFKSKLGSAANGFNNTKEYSAWINMIQRCYYNDYEIRRQGYTCYDGISIDESWKCFQDFAEWYVPRREVIDSAGILKANLDKEILSPSKKATLYSAETCCVIPPEINSMLIGISKSKKDGLPAGIIKGKHNFRVSCTSVSSRIVYSVFDSVEECVNWRNSILQNKYRFMADKYKHVLETKVYEKLYNWDKF